MPEKYAVKIDQSYDSVREGEGGKIWENGVETCIISCMERLLRLRCFRFSPPGHVC